MDARERLIVPLAIAATGMWIAAGCVALITDRYKVFLIASGPVASVYGYVFGAFVLKRVNGKGDL